MKYQMVKSQRQEILRLGAPPGDVRGVLEHLEWAKVFNIWAAEYELSNPQTKNALDFNRDLRLSFGGSPTHEALWLAYGKDHTQAVDWGDDLASEFALDYEIDQKWPELSDKLSARIAELFAPGHSDFVADVTEILAEGPEDRGGGGSRLSTIAEEDESEEGEARESIDLSWIEETTARIKARLAALGSQVDRDFAEQRLEEAVKAIESHGGGQQKGLFAKKG